MRMLLRLAQAIVFLGVIGLFYWMWLDTGEANPVGAIVIAVIVTAMVTRLWMAIRYRARIIWRPGEGWGWEFPESLRAAHLDPLVEGDDPAVSELDLAGPGEGDGRRLDRKRPGRVDPRLPWL